LKFVTRFIHRIRRLAEQAGLLIACKFLVVHSSFSYFDKGTDYTRPNGVQPGGNPRKPMAGKQFIIRYSFIAIAILFQLCYGSNL
jgi:hypothetical protein